MKKTIIILMFILIIPIAYSLYGGETWSYHFNKCDHLIVNITAIDKIDSREYSILSNCSNATGNYYTCDCYDDYNFTIKFHNGAVNNYTFYFNYDYDEWSSDTAAVSGSGSSGGGTFAIRFEEGKPIIKMLMQNIKSRFWLNGLQHTVKVINISKSSVLLEFMSNPIIVKIDLNETKEIDLNNDLIADLKVTLKEIRGRVVFLEFENLKKEIIENNKTINETKEGESATPELPQETTEKPQEHQEEKVEDKSIGYIFLAIIALIIIMVIIAACYCKLKKVGS